MVALNSSGVGTLYRNIGCGRKPAAFWRKLGFPKSGAGAGCQSQEAPAAPTRAVEAGRAATHSVRDPEPPVQVRPKKGKK